MCMFKMMDSKMRYAIIDEKFGIFAEEVETWKGFEDYAPKLREFLNTYNEKAVKGYEPNNLSVLNHSDHHPKNMMFIKDEHGLIKDVCMVSIFHQIQSKIIISSQTFI